MKYLDCAPDSLVNLHKSLLKKEAENLDGLFLPASEENNLLSKLITDIRMREVWGTLNRKRQGEHDPIKFYFACIKILSGWEIEPKITQKERESILNDIKNSINSLRSSLLKLNDFKSFSIDKLIDDKTVKWLVDNFDEDFFNSDLSIEEQSNKYQNKIDFVRFLLFSTIPSFDDVLIALETKTKASTNQSVTVKKPNSENARTHFFVRKLSQFFKSYFGQPLHESVAITTSVVLDIDIDIDSVRGLLK